MSKIELDDVFSFFIADTFDDPMVELFNVVFAVFCNGCYCETQAKNNLVQNR